MLQDVLRENEAHIRHRNYKDEEEMSLSEFKRRTGKSTLLENVLSENPDVVEVVVERIFPDTKALNPIPSENFANSDLVDDVPF